MKRSEVIERILGLLELDCIETHMPLDVMAHNLFANLDEMGMIPPAITKTSRDGFIYTVHEWEEE